MAFGRLGRLGLIANAKGLELLKPLKRGLEDVYNHSLEETTVKDIQRRNLDVSWTIVPESINLNALVSLQMFGILFS